MLRSVFLLLLFAGCASCLPVALQSPQDANRHLLADEDTHHAKDSSSKSGASSNNDLRSVPSYQAACSNCTELGGYRPPGSNKCFLLHDSKKSWTDAKQDCVASDGGVLAQPRTAGEDEQIRQIWKKNGIQWRREDLGGLWLGISDRDQEGAFKFVDTTTPTYTNWANVYGQQQPNNWNNQDCVSYGYSTTGGWGNNHPVKGWVDNSCGIQQPYVCEVKACEPPANPAFVRGNKFRICSYKRFPGKCLFPGSPNPDYIFVYAPRPDLHPALIRGFEWEIYLATGNVEDGLVIRSGKDEYNDQYLHVGGWERDVRMWPDADAEGSRWIIRQEGVNWEGSDEPVYVIQPVRRHVGKSLHVTAAEDDVIVAGESADWFELGSGWLIMPAP